MVRRGSGERRSGEVEEVADVGDGGGWVCDEGFVADFEPWLGEDGFPALPETEGEGDGLDGGGDVEGGGAVTGEGDDGEEEAEGDVAWVAERHDDGGFREEAEGEEEVLCQERVFFDEEVVADGLAEVSGGGAAVEVAACGELFWIEAVDFGERGGGGGRVEGERADEFVVEDTGFVGCEDVRGRGEEVFEESGSGARVTGEEGDAGGKIVRRRGGAPACEVGGGDGGGEGFAACGVELPAGVGGGGERAEQVAGGEHGGHGGGVICGGVEGGGEFDVEPPVVRVGAFLEGEMEEGDGLVGAAEAAEDEGEGAGGAAEVRVDGEGGACERFSVCRAALAFAEFREHAEDVRV
jgi:hypothetical protein